MASGVKRQRSDGFDYDYEAVLLDIEGTTTPISFVKDILFPYAKKNVKVYLERNWGTTQCTEDIEALRNQAKKDKDIMEGVVSIPDLDDENQSSDDKNGVDSSRETIIDAAVKNVLWQMSSDRKTTALKQLQGHIWKEAYDDGKIKGDIFDDVTPAFKQWKSKDVKIYIYSSGSVAAQKLLFGNSKFGDLLQYINGHFDTNIGAKMESNSYEKIAEEMKMKPSSILFVTDVIGEAKAALEAGFKTAVSVRPGNADLTEADKKKFTTISTFDELFPETATKDSPRIKKAKPDV